MSDRSLKMRRLLKWKEDELASDAHHDSAYIAASTVTPVFLVMGIIAMGYINEAAENEAVRLGVPPPQLRRKASKFVIDSDED